MESHICIVQTALAALAAGLDTHVVADACCSRASSNHELAMARMRAAGATITTGESAMYELVGAAGTDEFRGLLSIVKS
jgi:nicotinamidase-related amidase